MKIQLHYPSNTIPISVTGNKCMLKCRHCGGFYLHSMKSPEDIDEILLSKNISSGSTSLLFSGGCDLGGAVPLWEHVELIRKMKARGYKLNFHTGLIPPDKIPLVAPLADIISYDFITDNETIREVYRLDANGQDFVRTYLKLREFSPVIPHITIGLLGGKILGEFRAIETLSKLDCKRLVFIVFIPTRGTYYQDCNLPAIEEVETVFAYARRKLTLARLGLGCMHPRGKYKFQLEMLAYKYNFDSYVNPSKKFVEFLNNNNSRTTADKGEEFQKALPYLVEITIKRECCAFF